ncbi:hypothetical protein MHH93_14035 [Priestia sp. FSL H7-0729]
MISKKKWTKDKNKTRLQIDVVSNASISRPDYANGKNIPLLIVNTTDHLEVEKAIVTEPTQEYGRVNTKWGKSTDRKKISLVFSFIEPIPVEFFVFFDIEKQGGLIDLIVHSQLLYLQPGTIGDRLSNNLNSPKVLIEVPSRHFKKEWKLIFENTLKKNFIKQGLKKREAKLAALDFQKEWETIRGFRNRTKKY